MRQIEKQIAPLIPSQLPTVNRESGDMFVTFLRHYYQWMEKSIDQLTIDDVSLINVGDRVTQASTTALVLAIINESDVIVQREGYGAFTPTSESATRAQLQLPNGDMLPIARVSRFNVGHWARHLPETRDIDITLDEFILQFKNKYLSDVQFTTASNKQLFIKNALDFYRAKGTPRAVDLFFKLIYGFGAEIYYPARDLFRPSDNNWNDSTYLEIETKDSNRHFVGRTIYGTLSNSQAFASSLIRIRHNSREISVLYFTNLRGTFVTTENVYTKDLPVNVSARVIGSLSTFVVNRSDANFDVGETVTAITGDGRSARGRVRSTQSDIGVIRFELEQGGWGYTENAEIIGSEYVLSLADVEITSTDHEYYINNEPIQQFETARQNIIKVEGPTLDPSPAVGTPVVFSDVVPTEVISGVVAQARFVDGTFTIFVDVPIDPAAVIASIASVTVDGVAYSHDAIEDASNVVEVLDTRRTYNIQYSVNGSSVMNQEQRLIVGDILHQDATINGVSRRIATAVVEDVDVNIPLGVYLARIRRIENTIRTNLPFYTERSDTLYDTTSITQLDIGVDVISINTLLPNAKLRSDPQRSGVVANVTGVFSYINKADFVIGGFEATHTIPDGRTDARIQPLLSTLINDASYHNIIQITRGAGEPTEPVGQSVVFLDAGANTIGSGVISEVNVGAVQNTLVYTSDDPSTYVLDIASVEVGGEAFSYDTISVIALGVGYNSTVAEYAAAVAHPFEDVIIGQIEDIVVTNPGRGYPVDPFFIVYETRSDHLQRHDYIIHYTPAGRNFIVGERIRVEERDFLAQIVRHDRDEQIIYATRLHLATENKIRVDGPLDASPIGTTVSFFNGLGEVVATGTVSLIVSDTTSSIYVDVSSNPNDYINDIASVTIDGAAYAHTGLHPINYAKSMVDDLLTGEVIVGDSTRITATVKYAYEHRTARRTGRNAVIGAESIDGEGFATVVEVIDSGFGYSNEQPMTLASIADPSKRVEVTGYLGQHGIGQGYHMNNRSFLSSDKYLHDNDYYQEYSYEVRAPLPFDDYSQTIKDVLHVAGTKPFGKYVSTNDVSINLTATALFEQTQD